MNIAKQLKCWRKRHWLTQPAAAELLGVPVRTLQEWEQGRMEPRGLARRTLENLLKENLKTKERKNENENHENRNDSNRNSRQLGPYPSGGAAGRV